MHEGGVYLPVHRFDETARTEVAPEGDAPGLADAVDRLFVRTHKRSYLGVLERRSIKIAVIRGRQGMPRMPGLGTHISDSAHALAMGKVVLAALRPEALQRYIAGGLRAFTARTITSPDTLAGRARRGPADRRRLRPRRVRRGLLLRRRADPRRGRRAARRARAVGLDARIRRRARRACHGCPRRRPRGGSGAPLNGRRTPAGGRPSARRTPAVHALPGRFPTSCGNGGVSCFSRPSGRPFRHTPSRASLRRRSRRSCACRSGGRRASRRYIDPLSPPAPRSRRVRCRMSVPLKGGITQ